jgi:hypothetical protein
MHNNNQWAWGRAVFWSQVAGQIAGWLWRIPQVEIGGQNFLFRDGKIKLGLCGFLLEAVYSWFFVWVWRF